MLAFTVGVLKGVVWTEGEANAGIPGEEVVCGVKVVCNGANGEKVGEANVGCAAGSAELVNIGADSAGVGWAGGSCSWVNTGGDGRVSKADGKVTSGRAAGLGEEIDGNAGNVGNDVAAVVGVGTVGLVSTGNIAVGLRGTFAGGKLGSVPTEPVGAGVVFVAGNIGTVVLSDFGHAWT